MAFAKDSARQADLLPGVRLLLLQRGDLMIFNAV